ncbi:helix-turn-helix domain-containing protein [Sphingobacterium wenxiniae]|uniref:AraC-type DNA-binding protein n=1 Tax=Sphingobacterium wenxiniae TaxID=683125 RepID=A0A1I6R8L2_9SPHI|nr:helix-turn-helix domain-containing protein [Sphingobacterium wenxiniae]SFS61051.1 AraC-type DNA-binding protein [Sphingobacterium wenxiniae]
MSTTFFICKFSELNQYVSAPKDHLRRECYTMVFTGNEGAVLSLNKKDTSLPPHSLLFISPSCLLSIPEQLQDTDILQFSDEFYIRSYHDTDFLQSSSLFPEGSYSSIEVPDNFLRYVQNVISLLYDAFQHMDNPLYLQLIRNLLEQALIQTSIHKASTNMPDFFDDADKTIVNLFKESIKQHIHKSRAVKFYADKLNMTSKRLAKATYNVTDKTPKDMITEYIVSQLKWELIYSELSIKEIGRSYGFLDENNFSAFFSKEMRVTPKEFRKQQRKKPDRLSTKT